MKARDSIPLTELSQKLAMGKGKEGSLPFISEAGKAAHPVTVILWAPASPIALCKHQQRVNRKRKGQSAAKGLVYILQGIS